MDYIAVFFAGAFLCNSLPHLACGLSGAPFPTPFAKPVLLAGVLALGTHLSMHFAGVRGMTRPE